MGTTTPKNNFEFLRLIFAVFVLVTHSYELAGQSFFDFLFAHTDFQVGFSYIGVRGFFVISGYLIFQSLLRSKDVLDYFWKRILRIFPGLLVVLVITVLLGAVVYEGAAGGYWTSAKMWSYIPNNLLLYPFQPAIPGVFESNVYPKVINGSLWTICYEFTCYLGLAMLFLVRKAVPGIMKWLLLAMFLFVGVFSILYPDELYHYSIFINGRDLFELSSYFLGGTLLAAFRYERFKWLDWATVISVVVLVISVLLGQFLHGFHYLFLPLVVIGFGIRSTPILRDIGHKVGDLSYGIYIYGFLVQQTLMHFFKLDYLSLFFATVPITLILGYASWHLVEKRALKLKNWRPTGWLERKIGIRKGD
jgi:peptidoglycan/LPS O-acetylase OafA/YrhL